MPKKGERVIVDRCYLSLCASEATGKLRLGCILPLSTNNISGAVVKGLGQGILSGHYKTNVSPRYYSRNAVHWQHKNYQTPLRLLSLITA